MSELFRCLFPGDKITFYDEIESIQQEVDRLEALNITKIIALGHSGIEKDMELAKKVKGVDIVVGGRSNTFLYNGKNQNIYNSLLLLVSLSFVTLGVRRCFLFDRLFV